MKDIRLTEDNDIDLNGGDIAYTESTRQHQRDIILAAKGDYRLAPDRGVGVMDFLNNESQEEFFAELRRQLAADGQKVRKIGMEGGELLIKASYANE